MTIKKENFEFALSLAIDSRRQFEREHLHYRMNSCLVAGQEVLNASIKGEKIEVEE